MAAKRKPEAKATFSSLVGRHKFKIGLVAVAVAAIGTFMIVQSSAATNCRNTTYRQGSSGACVKVIQRAVGAYPDGSFGPATKTKVKALQYTYLGAKAQDGVVGPKTWSAICAKIYPTTRSPKTADVMAVPCR